MTVRSLLTKYIALAFKMPPHIFLKKVINKSNRVAFGQYLKFRDKRKSTYCNKEIGFCLKRYFPSISPESTTAICETIYDVTSMYINHRFDLLGSGWTTVEHGKQCRGLEGYRYSSKIGIEPPDAKGTWLIERINHANLKDSMRVWQMIDGDYKPIDWQLDFKSGYRWSEKTWYKDIAYGDLPGVDVKVPWELARMQHLVQLALAYNISKNNACDSLASNANQHQPKRYLREFRNQILDFIATNPPRFGVNWNCTMDVGIRVANWLVAYDLFIAFGAKFDNNFDKIFKRSIFDHGRHIINNLEWNELLRSNHYLANISGLLFASAYLPYTPETLQWLEFSVKELISETKFQFNNDGSNFEASTSYHRLSAEMVTYSTALALCLFNQMNLDVKIAGNTGTQFSVNMTSNYRKSSMKNNQELELFPNWYLKKLERMAEFTMHITKANGHITQVGDNDSGRFLKIQPQYLKTTVKDIKQKYANLDCYDEYPDSDDYWEEDILDHRHLVASINGIIDRDDFYNFIGNGFIEYEIIQKMTRDSKYIAFYRNEDPFNSHRVRIGHDGVYQSYQDQIKILNNTNKQSITIELNYKDSLFDLNLFGYPDFGIYIFCSHRIHLSVRCGPVGQNDNGGHAHNDQLSIELQVDGQDWITDPGTYLYTPFPELRNLYRSVKSHSGPRIVNDIEPSKLDLHLFHLPELTKSKCIYFGTKGFIGVHYGYITPVYRMVELQNHQINIFDFTDGDLAIKKPKLGRVTEPNSPSAVPISPGYGIKYHSAYFTE